ncbi:MAG: PD-(D/E)XK nuclease family protein [Clostridiales bacterium]|nr:PD-(D/E)XK nuclease family protein [Clostridiales bacterium]
MSLTYLLGGPGTGKTTRLLTDLIASAESHPDQRHVILVPEQFTMQTQRDVVRLHPRHAVLNIDVLSFERLAHRVFNDLGQENPPILTELGKNMLLRKISQEKSGQLSVFRRNIRKPGFISRLMGILSEFYEYGITEKDLNERKKELTEYPLLNHKLHDLEIIYHSFREALGKDSMVAEELLPRLASVLPRSSYLDHAVVAFDNFTGFTSVQFQILQTIFLKADSISMAFLLPEKEAEKDMREEDLFYMSRTAISACNELASQAGISSQSVFLTKMHRYESQELICLAEGFLRPENPCKMSGEIHHISAMMMRNPSEEADYAASLIHQLIQNGYRYREIAVVTGDLEEYRPYLESSFRRAGIPIFLDRKKGILGNPLVEYIRSAVQTLENGFSYEAVFRCLRSGLSVLTQEETDLLDQYCLAWGIRGRRQWEQNWEKVSEEEADDIQEINKNREKFLFSLSPLLELEKSNNITVKEKTKAICRMMELVRGREQMEQMADELPLEKTVLKEEYHKVYDFLDDILCQMDCLLGDEKITWQEFSEILDAGLSEARIGMIPATLDQVIAGDVMRSRLTNIRVLIVLGFNDGKIPKPPVSGGILSEEERDILLRSHLNMAPSAETLSGQERFYLYTLFTKPSCRLYLSMSKLGMDGSSQKPSYLSRYLKMVFPEFTIQDGEKRDVWDQITTVSSAWQTMASHMDSLKKEESGEIWNLAQCLYEEKNPDRMKRILDSSFTVYEGSSISRNTAVILYGNELIGSVTRMEQYASCAYAQFLKYGLGLTERRTHEFTGSDRGSFFHKVLEIFFTLCRKRHVSFRELTEEEREEILEDSYLRASQEGNFDIMDESAGNRYLKHRWKEIAGRTIWALCRMLSEEDFRPEAMELYFDGWTSSSMKIPLSQEEQMILRGIVDRLDIYMEEDKVYLRIIDYKTSASRFDLNAVYQGLQLQLPLYMNAAMEYASVKYPGKTAVPAGMYYYTVEDPLMELETMIPKEKREEKMLRELTFRGLSHGGAPLEHQKAVTGDKATEDQFRQLQKYVRHKIRQFGREILDGNISSYPYKKKGHTGCDYCSFAGICEFDPRIDGYHYNKTRELKKEEIWKKMEEESHGDTVDDGTAAGN